MSSASGKNPRSGPIRAVPDLPVPPPAPDAATELVRSAETVATRIRGLERSLRDAEQRLHSEVSLREDLEQEYEELEERLNEQRRGIRELETEAEEQRRRAYEAEHALAVADTARRRAERQVSERIAIRMVSERLIARSAPAAAAPAYGSAAPARFGSAISREQAMRRARESGGIAALGLRRATAELEQHEAAWRSIDEIRARLPSAGPAPPTAPEPEELDEISERLVALAAADGEAESDPGAPVELERFTEALSRLRQSAPAREGESVSSPAVAIPTAAAAWLPRALRRLAAQDPAGAGGAIVAMLRAQHLAVPGTVAYDLNLAEVGWVGVTAQEGGRTRVETLPGPRPVAERAFVLEGDLESLARSTFASRPRLLFMRGVARVDGHRRPPAPIVALTRAPLSIESLRAAGVVFPPALALRLLSLAIEPAWTVGERFSVGYRSGDSDAPGARLEIRDGRPPLLVPEHTLWPATATVHCEPAALPAVLAGDIASAVEVGGDHAVLPVLARWIARAHGVASALPG